MPAQPPIMPRDIPPRDITPWAVRPLPSIWSMPRSGGLPAWSCICASAGTIRPPIPATTTAAARECRMRTLGLRWCRGIVESLANWLTLRRQDTGTAAHAVHAEAEPAHRGTGSEADQQRGDADRDQPAPLPRCSGGDYTECNSAEHKAIATHAADRERPDDCRKRSCCLHRACP